MSRADYPGVPAGEKQERSLPLTLSGKPGVFIPATSGRHVQVSYQLEVECDIAFAFDIEAHLPVRAFNLSVFSRVALWLCVRFWQSRSLSFPRNQHLILSHPTLHYPTCRR